MASITYRPLSASATRKQIGRRVRFSKEANALGFDLTPDDDFVAIGAFNAAGKLVGMARYRVVENLRYGRTLDSSFTWVHYLYRRRGVGVELWRRAVRRTNAATISLTPITPGGWALAKRLTAEGFARVRA